MPATKKRALYAGTFDPFTNGHEDIVKRALGVFDEVIVLIAVSPTKTPLFSKDERVNMLTELFAGDERVVVDHWDGLIVDYAKQKNIGSLIRGLRPTGDFESEFQMAAMNTKLYPEIETYFLMTAGEHYFISSTMVREVYGHKGDIMRFVPKTVGKYLEAKKKDS
ncbi:MAG: pantetheine-phosphate adenylyltransferase [Bdellovibrionaceae bacterium]|nr:pantetheine-phosphate adenylyltransferase [Halobacteriovorax sp.]MBN20109.1 pantetheine-phosphate adenylyltransferase [Pseudobdellovibrionaceae bacterium]|tara:strand:+ start:39464 stop:39958 length:495 start_codon:yes stop_codon:yes gene_type:complete